jgi:hypothetical protein
MASTVLGFEICGPPASDADGDGESDPVGEDAAYSSEQEEDRISEFEADGQSVVCRQNGTFVPVIPPERRPQPGRLQWPSMCTLKTVLSLIRDEKLTIKPLDTKRVVVTHSHRVVLRVLSAREIFVYHIV